ncbi:MAG: hypothetical protein GY715_01995 [Planctomycetes bacterium]|nr:hypothetical protein [Planctomycetota bacterium]
MTPRVLRLVVVIVLLSPLLLALLPRSEVTPMPPARTATAADGPPTPRPELPRPLLGFAINAHHISDLPAYLRAVDGIRDLGANTLIIVTPMFQRYANSSRITIPRSLCPSDEQLVALLERGRQHGMHTILMPIVLIEKPGDKDWRGVIRPDDWDAWWQSYEKGLDRYVRLANRTGVDMLSIGSELNSTEEQLDRWAGIARRVRDQYPGKIMYSANWDRYDRTSIWPLVDVMSVSSYFELERDRPGAPEPDLVAAWVPIRTKLLEHAAHWKRPLLLSEIGYPSLPWANAHPWNYVADDGEEADHDAQARSWRAFLTAWSGELTDASSNLIGFCGYRWDPYHSGGDDDTGYGIAGKPSHDVIRLGLGDIRRRAERQAADAGE